jgi:hypothetical protein
MPFSNSLAAVAAAASILCLLLVRLAPELYLGLAQSWFHALNLSLFVADEPIGATGALIGLVTLSLVAWIWGAMWACVADHPKWDHLGAF